MIEIKQFRLSSPQSRISQPYRYAPVQFSQGNELV